MPLTNSLWLVRWQNRGKAHMKQGLGEQRFGPKVKQLKRAEADLAHAHRRNPHHKLREKIGDTPPLADDASR